MKTVNFSQQARFLPMGGTAKPKSVVDRLLDIFRPAQDKLEDHLIGIGGMLAAATYNYKGGYQAGVNTGMPVSGYSVSVADIKLDFPTIVAARLAASQTALAATDTLELISLPVGIWVPVTFVQVTTAEGETATIDVGDGVDPNGFIAAGDVNTVGWLNSFLTTPYSVAVGGGRLYTAADTIDILMNTATFNLAVLSLRAVLVDARGYRS